MNKPWVEHVLTKRIPSPEQFADALSVVRSLAQNLENMLTISRPKDAIEESVVRRARAMLKLYREGPK